MKKSIDLLIVTHCFPANSQDIVGNFLYEFSKSFRSLGGNVTIYTPKMSVEYDEQFIRDGVNEVIYFDWKGGEKRLAEMKISSIKDIISLASLFRNGRIQLIKLLKSRSFDYVLSPWAIPNGYFISKVPKTIRPPYGIWALGSDINKYATKPLLGSMIRRGYKLSDNSFGNSIGLVKKILEGYGKFTEMLPTNRKLPETDAVYERSRKLKLLFIGRLEEVKGGDILIDAIHLSGRGDDLEVKILGEGSQYEFLNQKIDDYGLFSSIKIEGFKTSIELARYLKESDYLVISSRSEGMPVVFWEAMQSETPVLATDVGDINYYCDLYNVGRVVDISPKELGDLIGFVTEFRELRDCLSRNCRKLAERVTIERSAEKLYNLIEKQYIK